MAPDTPVSDSGASYWGASDSVAPDALISRLSCKPSFPFHSMVYTHDKVIKPKILKRIPPSSSLGPLDTMPTELKCLILDSLDFQSLLRFAQVCHQAKILVESLLSYQDLTKHASPTLMAMSQMNVITLHTAATMHAALRSDKCVSCPNFGPFIFLPTCKRCCYECLQKETSLQVVTARMAELYFGLSEQDLVSEANLGRMLMMVSLPRWCPKVRAVRDETLVTLFCSLQAEKLGISVHGSLKAARDRGHATSRLDASLQIPSPYEDIEFTDKFYCVASTRFPALRPNGKVEQGIWCLGCRKLEEDYEESFSTNFFGDPDDFYDPRSCEGAEYHARSRSDFLEHIKDCKGVQDLLRETEKEILD